TRYAPGLPTILRLRPTAARRLRQRSLTWLLGLLKGPPPSARATPRRAATSPARLWALARRATFTRPIVQDSNRGKTGGQGARRGRGRTGLLPTQGLPALRQDARGRKTVAALPGGG